MSSRRHLTSHTIATRLRASVDVVITVEHDGTTTLTFDGSDTPLLRFVSLEALRAAFALEDDDLQELRVTA